jgi:hypothetical protein
MLFSMVAADRILDGKASCNRAKENPAEGERWGTLTAGFTWSLMKKAD